jgi:EAL domain-containing protein (putative c-di-GMP-specific phosphodiesterase class I)
MLDKPEEAKIVKAIVSLGRALGLKTVAEGIENEDVREVLRKLGCNMGQGFLFGKAAPAAVTSERLRQTAGRRDAGRQAAALSTKRRIA